MTKILVIGLDAATLDLIGPWAGKGHLPTLDRLIQQGAATRLLSTPNMHSASAWTSILTGLNPGRHGLFVFSDRDFATGKQVFFKGGDRHGELLSTHLSRHGLTSGFLNVPMTYPASCEGGGFTVSGLDAPSLNERAFCPGDIRAELLDRFPGYHFSPPGLGDLMREGRLNAAVSAWVESIETQTLVAEYLISHRPVDFFMTVYTASDWAGHNLWKSLEKDPTDNALLQIYRALDRAIERLLKHASAETQVYVISDHGMGPHTGASYHLAEWLESKGYMVRSVSPKARRSIIGASRSAARSLLPVSVRERVKAGLGEDRIQKLQSAEKDSFYSSLDWEHTTAYTEPGRHVVNINLEGRNPTGKVPPSEYQRVCTRIMEDLSEWVDDRGVRVVDRVARREDVYSGPYASRASDLHVYWNPGANLGAPPNEVRDRGFWWSGDHRPEGVMIVTGPRVKAKPPAVVPMVYDFVPTIMYGAGLPVPDKLDGRVIQELFTDEFVKAHPIEIGSAGSQSDADQIQLSAEEERLVEEKLRGLGYL